jgi:hypothetical protein
VFGQDAYFPVGVTKDDQLFAQNFGSYRLAVGFGYLFNQTDRCPMAPHELSHGGVSGNTAQKLILLGCHDVLL